MDNSQAIRYAECHARRAAGKRMHVVRLGRMSSENRDWYRDWWRKKTGYVERADFRRPARQVEREKEVRFTNWHPVLKLLAAVASLGIAAIVGKILARLVG